MDLHPTLRRAARRIAEVLHEYAATRGWKYTRWQDWSEGDYSIEMTLNEQWLRFDVQFIATGFAGMDPYQAFNSVQDWLESQLINDPELARMVDIRPMTPEQFERVSQFSLSDPDVRVDAELIASAMPSTGPSPTTP